MSSTESTDLRPEAGTTASDKIAVMVAPFTGGPFSVQVSRKDSVEDFKKIVAKRLKVLKDRICLLYRDRYVHKSLNKRSFPRHLPNSTQKCKIQSILLY